MATSPGHAGSVIMFMGRTAVAELIVITGPPGAGKSSVAEHLTNSFTPSALVPGDSFFAMIKQGYILPWLPKSHRQNTVIIEAAAAAAGRLTEICSVIYDGVLGPWFLPTFVRATGLADIHYVILLPPLEVCLERVQSRVDHAFRDQSATRDLYEQFANAAVDSRHVICRPHDRPAQLTEFVRSNLDEGRFRYSAV